MANIIWKKIDGVEYNLRKGRDGNLRVRRRNQAGSIIPASSIEKFLKDNPAFLEAFPELAVNGKKVK